MDMNSKFMPFRCLKPKWGSIQPRLSIGADSRASPGDLAGEVRFHIAAAAYLRDYGVRARSCVSSRYFARRPRGGDEEPRFAAELRRQTIEEMNIKFMSVIFCFTIH